MITGSANEIYLFYSFTHFDRAIYFGEVLGLFFYCTSGLLNFLS